MTQFMVSVYWGSVASNLLLALIILFRSHRNQISQFYFFCVSCLTVMGGFALLLSSPMHPMLRLGLHHTVVFFYALFPFFFIHFITIFLRRNEVARSPKVVMAIYIVGLFAYAMVLEGYIPKPVSLLGQVQETGGIFYVTWMTIFFSLGVAMLFELSGKFRERVKQANVLFVSFSLLLLVLPGPFTESVFFRVLGLNVNWYFYICISALLVAVYFIFRHKIITNTIYDALRTALAVMNDILIVLDESFQIQMIRGNAVAALLGYQENDLVGQPLGKILGQEDSLGEYRANVEHGKMHEMYFDSDVLSKDGKRVPMNFSITPMYVDNELSGFVSIARDITDRKHLEEELRQAQKMESLGTLAGGIAHDFNNILQIILVNTSSLKRKVLEPEKVNQVVDINTKAVQRGAGLVQQVLMFARKTEVQFKSLNLNTIIEDLKKMLGETFPKTITFSLSLNKLLPPIFGDQGQVHQVLLNLCVNARDAMTNGGHIYIATDLAMGWAVRKKFGEALDQQYVSITVTDTGQGMPESVRARIFEPFFTTKEKGKGTGLGLAVVYGIIKAHKGFIEVQSDVGVGTTFQVYFPIATDEQKAVEEKGDGHEPVARGAETILVVEDEEVLLQSLELLLSSQGYTVLSAKDGYEAVEMFRQNTGKISLVILDIGLPKLNGWDAFAKMKDINPRIKCIISSGYLDPVMKSGRENFILKPYEPNEILKQVRRVLDQVPA